MGEWWVQVGDIASVHKIERERRQHGHALTLVHIHAIMHTQTSLYLKIMKNKHKYVSFQHAINDILYILFLHYKSLKVSTYFIQYI